MWEETEDLRNNVAQTGYAEKIIILPKKHNSTAPQVWQKIPDTAAPDCCKNSMFLELPRGVEAS